MTRHLNVNCQCLGCDLEFGLVMWAVCFMIPLLLVIFSLYVLDEIIHDSLIFSYNVRKLPILYCHLEVK